MSKKLSAVLILCMSTVCLSGCDLLRVTGPCYGVGCPSRTAGGSGQYKPGEAPKAQNAAVPAPVKSAVAPTQATSAQSSSVQPTAPAQPAATKSPTATAATAPQAATAQATSTPAATAQPAPAQEANAQTKPSPFHAIGEFFERLIPHHNSGANSGAGN
jgi:hypothetical protein